MASLHIDESTLIHLKDKINCFFTGHKHEWVNRKEPLVCYSFTIFEQECKCGICKIEYRTNITPKTPVIGDAKNS